MKSTFAFIAFAVFQLSGPAIAQQPTTPSSVIQAPTNYSFAVVVASRVLTVEGDWKQSTQLREYANAHHGSYIVFATDDGLHLVTDPAEISKASSLYKEVARLAKEQEALSAKQAPLAKRQEELAAEMKKANSPEQMRRVGAEQGRVGGEQGAIGQDQGKVGQEQGVAGRALYDDVQTSIKACQLEHRCSAA